MPMISCSASNASQSTMTSGTFKKNGLSEKLNVHGLRHSNVSLLIADDADAATAAGALRHSQLSTTLDICTHTFDKNRKAVGEVLQQGGIAWPNHLQRPVVVKPATENKNNLFDFFRVKSGTRD